MIIYSVTLNVDDEIHDTWLQWMKNTHIPDVMNTGFFESHKMCRIISHLKENEGTTYNIQYRCKSMADLHQYQSKHAPQLQKEHQDLYQDKVVAFRTLLEEVE